MGIMRGNNGARRIYVVATAVVLFTVGCDDALAQSLQVQNDSLQVQFINTDVRAAIRAIAPFLDRPVLASGIGDVRLEIFQTPGRISTDEVPELLRGIVEASGLVLQEDSAYYRVSRSEDAATVRGGQQPPTAEQEQVEPVHLHTVRLQHARAGDVAATLNQLYGTGQGFTRPAGLSTTGLTEGLRSDRMGGAGAPAEQQATGGPTEAELSSPVTIVPDGLTNSLLIRATQSDFDVLEEGIAQLDVRPLQVLIEVVVVEARKDRQFAVGFGAELPPTPVAGADVSGTLGGGGLGDLVIQVMGMGRADVNGILTAARRRGDVEILSRPVLLASNNTEATLLVGTQRPFVQVSRSLPTDTPQRDQVVQYRDVGTKLAVLPTINQDGYVSLLIRQEISAATGETQFDAPVISSRETTTQVLVKDQQTIVIGGLTDELRDRVRTGVPLLADIPLLGGLFGSTDVRTTETELFLFITPTIIMTDQDLARATLDRVPDRILDADFIQITPISPPPVDACSPDDPGCGR